MPNYIVLRLIPPAAVDAGIFTNDYLTNLSISVSDISYGQPNAGVPIGTVTIIPPVFPPTSPSPIVQHDDLGVPQSVATAIIEYPALPPDPEYITPDLLITFNLGGVQTVTVPQIYYDVQLFFFPPGPFPAPAAIQAIPDGAVSAFVTLPASTTTLSLPTDGSPPNFDDLDAAVSAVLAADPGVPPTAAEKAALNVDQCRNIANEIIYGPQAPLPLPTKFPTLDDMFTLSPTENTGDVQLPPEQNRQQFKGQLASYYGTRDAAVLQLTNYVFALSVAYWLEAQTVAATQALVTFPANPNVPTPPLATATETEIILSGALGLDVPAPYFYALNYDLTTQSTQTTLQQKQNLEQATLGADQQTNLDRMTAALNAGWISPLLPATLNPAQAARIIELLNIPTTTTAPLWPITIPSAGAILKTGFVLPPQPPWLGFRPWRPGRSIRKATTWRGSGSLWPRTRPKRFSTSCSGRWPGVTRSQRATPSPMRSRIVCSPPGR